MPQFALILSDESAEEGRFISTQTKGGDIKMARTKRELIEALEQLSVSELEALLEDVRGSKEVPYEMVKMSALEGKEEKTRVIVMDKKMLRKIKPGDEEKLEEIAEAEGIMDVDLRLKEPPAAPSGSTTISGSTISASTLSSYIVRDFGPVCRGGAVFLSDGFYFLYPDSEVQKVLSEDLTDLQMWISTYFDCDDFAQVVAGEMNNQLKGIPFGTLWFKGAGIYHAVNCYYSLNQRRMKVVEPQTDGIYNFDKSRFCPMLVVI